MALHDGVYGGGLTMKVSMTIRSNDPLLEFVSRATRIGERGSLGVRRRLVRHMQVVEGTQDPNAEMVSRLHSVAAHSPHILHGMEYPTKDVVRNAIQQSTIVGDKRMELLSYIDRITYAEYAKLIDSVESLRGI